MTEVSTKLSFPKSGGLKTASGAVSVNAGNGLAVNPNTGMVEVPIDTAAGLGYGSNGLEVEVDDSTIGFNESGQLACLGTTDETWLPFITNAGNTDPVKIGNTNVIPLFGHTSSDNVIAHISGAVNNAAIMLHSIFWAFRTIGSGFVNIIVFTAPNDVIKINGKQFSLTVNHQYFTVSQAFTSDSVVRPITFSNNSKTVTLSVNLAAQSTAGVYLTSTLIEF